MCVCDHCGARVAHVVRSVARFERRVARALESRGEWRSAQREIPQLVRCLYRFASLTVFILILMLFCSSPADVETAAVPWTALAVRDGSGDRS